MKLTLSTCCGFSFWDIFLHIMSLNGDVFDWRTTTGSVVSWCRHATLQRLCSRLPEVRRFPYCLCSYRDDLPKNLGATTAECCKKSTLDWRASPKTALLELPNNLVRGFSLVTSLQEFCEEKPVEYFNVFNTWVSVEPAVNILVAPAWPWTRSFRAEMCSSN